MLWFLRLPGLALTGSRRSYRGTEGASGARRGTVALDYRPCRAEATHPRLGRPLRTFVLALLGLAVAFPVPGLAAQAVPDTLYVPGEYRVFTGAGEPSSLDEVVQAMADHEVVFIGETHDDPTGHAVELELFRRAHEAYGKEGGTVPARPVALSLEFFQRDVQPILDEYLDGLITESAFRADSRPWPRYETDYRPLVEYAKSKSLPVIAANAPRRYVNLVTRSGRAALDQLTAEARATLAPLPYGMGSREYLDQWVGTMARVIEQERMKCGVPIADPPAHTSAGESTDAAGPTHHGSDSHGGAGSAFDGQVLWDATMAYWVSDHLVRHPGALVLHMVGSFHVARGTGTPEHLTRYRPGVSSLIVMMRPVEDVDAFEAAPAGEWGDFVVQTDGSRTLEALECREVAGRSHQR